MSILIRNVRGLNKERRQDLKEHLAKYTPSILVLVEIKVKPNQEHRILRCIPPYWFFTNNYEYSFFWGGSGFVGTQKFGLVRCRVKGYNKLLSPFQTMEALPCYSLQCMALTGKVEA